MFKVISVNLTAGQALHSLRVTISTFGEAEAFLGLVSSSYADHIYPQTVMREFRDMRPGDISRPHVAAFLTDPLRMIRRVKAGKKKGTFTLDFVGRSGRPWREIQGQIRALVQCDSPLSDYKPFHKYFDIARQFWDAHTRRPLSDKAVYQLCEARIQGDVKAFRSAHFKLLVRMEQIANDLLDPQRFKSAEDAQQREESVREIVYLAEELKANLPPVDTDRTFFGYTIADAGLLEWQTTGREAEKEAKAKRKREREVGEKEGRKKAKSGGTA